MSEAKEPQFEEDLIKERAENEQLLLYLGGFDGPIDMLLSLARDQKVDLSTISILDLANQYLDFIEKAQSLRLELAADYLVMAAWLAYLKSRMLIPQEELKQAEPSASELADALQFQLRRLEAMRKVANDLFNLPRLGVNVFGRGEPDGLPVKYIAKYEMTYYDLLKAYGDVKQRQQNSVYKLEPVRLFSLEEAIERMTNMLGKVPEEWVSLFMFLPGGLDDKIVKRSAIASTFGGALEMVKRGLLELQQEQNYATIYIRKPADKDGQAAPAGEDAGNGMSEAAEAALDDSFDEPIDPSQTVEAEMEADEEARAAEELKAHLAMEEEAHAKEEHIAEVIAQADVLEGAESSEAVIEEDFEDETITPNKEAVHHGEN